MNTMKSNHPNSSIEDRLLDRLVDGELSETERRQLLARLDHEPDGWRRCALAFLEAQTWKLALQEPVAPPVARSIPLPRPRSRLTRFQGLVMAASVMLAFWLGWFVSHRPSIGIEEVVQTSLDPSPLPEPLPPPTAVAQPKGPLVVPADPLLPVWEKNGFRAETRERVVSLESKDGRRIEVPVQEVRVRRVTPRTY